MGNFQILVTGATGYIGKHLVQAARKKNMEVTTLVRRRLQRFERAGVATFEYDLNTPPPEEAFRDIHAVIHLAAFTGETDPGAEEIELTAAKKLLEVSQNADVSHFIFVSSQSATQNAPTQYGKTKWLIEEEVRQRGGIVVRPGLVYGGRYEEALFGRLCRLVKKIPILPALFPAPQVQPIHVEDLCDALLTLATRENPPRITYCLAQPEAMNFTRFLQTLAWERYHRYRWTIPLPISVLKLFAHVKKLIPIFPDISLDRINGLLALPHMDTEESLQALDLNLHDLAGGLRPTNHRRRIMEEGNAFFHYLSDLPSGSFILRRYVRAVETLRDGKPLGLRPLFIQAPGLLRLIDPKRPVWTLRAMDQEDLLWHLSASVALLEASPQHTRLFTLVKSMGMLFAFVMLLFCILKEGVYIFLAVAWRLPSRLGFTKFSRVKDEF